MIVQYSWLLLIYKSLNNIFIIPAFVGNLTPTSTTTVIEAVLRYIYLLYNSLNDNENPLIIYFLEW